MAATKKTTTPKGVEQDSSTQDITQLLEMMKSMQEQFAIISNENKELKEKLEKINEDVVTENENIVTTSVEQVSPFVANLQGVQMPRKIKIYHMQELIGGTVTYIKLSKTTRSLTKMGELMTLDLDDFEELVGKYRHYFDKGILALSASDMDYAEMYDLPIYDQKTKAQYNSQVLRDVVNYSYDKLREFYNSLSENNKNSFLNYWLGQVYEKTPGYYNDEKLRWLNSISGLEVFSPILLEMENANRRKTQVVVDGNKM